MSGRWHAGRLGGEEFALLLDGRDMAETAEIAETLRARIAALRIPVGAGALSLTCSFGISEWQAGDGIDPLLKRADMAMYEAKLAGRNCVVAADVMFASPSYSSAGRAVRAAARMTG